MKRPTLPPVPFEVVPLPVLAAHERAQATRGRELPDYVPSWWPGRIAQRVRAWAPTVPAAL